MNTINISQSYEWGQFAPEFALAALAAIILMADSFLPKFPKRAYALLGAAGAFIAGCFLYRSANPLSWVACIATALTLLMAFDYTKVACASIAGEGNEEGTGEFYALPLIACAGICCLAEAKDLIMLFVSLETVTLSSYVLAGYFRRNQGSIEAGVKYLVLGAMSTGLLVFGMAWYFGTAGTFELGPRIVYSVFAGPMPELCAGFNMAIALLLAGAFFKAGAAPMHIWIPDVYQGAPTPISAFLAIASKAAGFIALYLIAKPFMINAAAFPLLIFAFALVAAATLLIGNLGAIGQSNAKRLLGYSSIGQAGFILIFFVDLNGLNIVNLASYLVAYGLATAVAFFAIAMVRTQRGHEELSAFRGLGKTNPRTAFLIAVAFASLAGVPLTLGFLVKLNSFIAMVHAMNATPGLAWQLPIMVICASAGFYYYFKVLREMYWERPQEGDEPLRLPLVTALAMSVCVLLLLALGTCPLLF